MGAEQREVEGEKSLAIKRAQEAVKEAEQRLASEAQARLEAQQEWERWGAGSVSSIL